VRDGHRALFQVDFAATLALVTPPRFDARMVAGRACCFLFSLPLVAVAAVAQPDPMPIPTFDIAAASRFAQLALDCVDREYPNKISHSLNGDTDVKPPRELTPIFFGCYDWHSAVHGHWLLVRLVRQFPQLPEAARIRSVLAAHFTVERAVAEAKYLEAPGRATFERPYGLAWLLQLAAELRSFGVSDSDAKAWHRVLAPLEAVAVQRIVAWLPKLSHAIRTGEHSQTAFAFGLLRDYAVGAGNEELLGLLDERTLHFHRNEPAWDLRFEPSGQDFLSPGLAVADLLRRTLPADEFAAWLGKSLPQIPRDGGAGWLLPAIVTDKSDGKLAHLDGLNLSRAWMLAGIAHGLPSDDPRRAAIAATAAAHRQAGLAAVTGEHYEGGHWLGSFAVYLVSSRGIAP
jgi:hypothetical protein